MTVISANFFSKCLNNFVDVSVYIPSYHNGDISLGDMTLDTIYDKNQKFRTIYLLHGMLDDHSCWMRWSMVEEQAEKHRIALVMPSGQNSFYVNNADGLNYYDFIEYELPAWAEMNFPLLTGRENRFIAGLSMGGYGSFRHAFSHPENYAAVGSFSGALDIMGLADSLKEFGADKKMVNMSNCFGREDVTGSDDDLFALTEKCAKSGQPLPKVYISCGTEDVICYKMDLKMKEYLLNLGYEVQYMEMPGVHEWKVWNASVREFIEMIDK